MLVIISKILLSSFFAWGVTNSYELAKSRCAPPEENEKVLYNSDFHWSYTFSEMQQRFQEIYSSGKRLKDRTYFRNGQFVLFYDLGLTGKLPVILTERLINSVTTHIQEAHRQGYIDFVFFPDMGHSHLMIPENFYREQIKDFPVKEINKAYEKMLGHPELRILYHTAEQLKTQEENKELIPDRHLLWRFFTRNLLGLSSDLGVTLRKALDTLGNTVSRADEGYHYWSAGFNISASEKGCFPYIVNGQTYYFDISLTDLPSPPGEGEGFYDGDIQPLGQNLLEMPLWLWELNHPRGH